MSNLVSGPGNYPRAEYNSAGKVYYYDLKLEINVKEKEETVALGPIFVALLKQMAVVAEHAVKALDIAGIEVSVDKPPPGDDFAKRFCVETFEGRHRKVMMGFKLETKTPLSTLKYRMMQFLNDRNIFIRIHTGGFAHGVKTNFLGFLQGEHPKTANAAELAQNVKTAVMEYFTGLDAAGKLEINKRVDGDFNMTTLPLTVSRTKIIAEHDSKKIDTFALGVDVPSTHQAVVSELLDGVILNGTSLPSFVPIALRKEDPTVYGKLVNNQAKYIHLHRNIQVENVTKDNLSVINESGGIFGDLLLEHSGIYKLYHDPARNRLHVSTDEKNLQAARVWIDYVVNEHKFPYNPSRVQYADTNSVAVSKVSRYSKLFTDTASQLSADSFDPSTIKTTKSRAWNPRVPMKIVYQPDAQSFPLLGKTAETMSTTQSTLAPNTIDIQSAIDSALKHAESEYDKKLQTLQTTMDERLAALETAMATMVAQVVEQTYNSLVSADSPFATKADNVKLQGDVEGISAKIDSLMQLMTASPTSPPRAKRVDHKETPLRPSAPTTNGDIPSDPPPHDVEMADRED
jgi:hypothetical protein